MTHRKNSVASGPPRRPVQATAAAGRLDELEQGVMAVRIRGLDPVLRCRAAEGRVDEILLAGSVAVRLAPLA